MNPALWVAVAAVVAAVVAVIAAVRACNLAADAQSIAVGHALDRSWHPAAPGPVLEVKPAPPSSPGGPSSG